jgi:PAS domain S-box-containing protein
VILRDITERKRSSEATARLAAIVESSTDAIVGKTLQGMVTSWNAAAGLLFGYDAGEMIGQSITKIIPAERLPEEERILECIRRGERVDHFETLRRRKDGTQIAVSVAASPIRDSKGNVIGVSKVARDVTQRRKIEQSLRDSEERFHAMFDNMLEGCQLIGFDWSYQYVNDSIVGHSRAPNREALLGKTMQQVFPGLEQTPIFAALERCMLQRVPERLDTLFEFPDGAQSWFEVSVQPAPEGIFILSIDITERKEAEALIRERDERFRQIAESLPQLIWTCTPDGLCDFVSRQWELYTGFDAASQVGDRSMERVHPDDRGAFAAQWVKAIARGEAFQIEIRLQRHDGVYRWFDTRATPLRDAQGNLVKWFGSNADIEDQQRARDMQLRSQKMEALGTLSGGIAHDFNNILLAIIGNTRLAIADLPPGHPLLESLHEIDRAGRRASDLVRRILAFSRQEEPERAVIHLQPVVDEALKLLRSTLPAMIELRSRASAELPATIADSGQVHQIIMNLATNAAHAIGSRRGGVVEIDLDKIEADTELTRRTPGLHEGTYVRLSVSDNGCGMNKATVDRMFDPFFTTKPVGQGTGLGLSVVDGIMKQHGGAITVYSQPDKGTALRLYFPATADSAESVHEQPAPVPSGQGQRVLYVDDDDALVFLAARTLKRLGYRITAYTDAREALEKFRSQPEEYDVVVTDLSMPVMPGTELVRSLISIRSDIPVVITSGYVRPEDQELARQLGAAALILKPNTIEELGRVLDTIFRQRASRTSATITAEDNAHDGD